MKSHYDFSKGVRGKYAGRFSATAPVSLIAADGTMGDPLSIRTSVLTLSYNRPDYLSEAIASVKHQIDDRWEHIVLDNGSTDERVHHLLRDLSERNERFMYLSGPPLGDDNQIGRCWNRLLQASSGEFVTILDDDNRKHPEFLQRMLAPMLADPSVDAVSCGWNRMDAEGRVFGSCHLNRQTALPLLTRTNTIDSNALVYRRRVIDRIGGYDETLTSYEDWHFIIRLVRHCKVVHLPEALVDYREHGGARSRIAVAKLGAHAMSDRIQKELFTEQELREAGLL